jgi:type VI secretion system secreted protein Hcp
VLSVARAGPAQQDYVTIKLSDIVVTSVMQSDDAGDSQPPLESVALSFAKVEYSYLLQNPDGSVAGAVEFKFDVKQNKVL